MMYFDANEQVPDGEENKLAGAVEDVKVSEDSIYRNQTIVTV